MGWAIALHGGAGNFQRSMSPEHQESCKAALRRSLKIGVDALKSGQSPLDVVEIVVRELEDNPHFNAGKGSDLSSNGGVEMEACIMDGKTMKCGAVSGLTTVKNPISLARLVMEKTSNVYLAFDGAEAFAREQGVETADSSYFITPENIEKLKQAKDANSNRDKNDNTKTVQKVEEHGTVGCVAVDGNGNLSAATSTGGVVNKKVGRIGGTPIVGAGTYANSMCAVSATGDGEAVIRATIARDVSALMEYKGISLKDASTYAIEEILPKSTAGFIAVSADGEVTMMFNTTGMFRACASEGGYHEVGIWPK